MTKREIKRELKRIKASEAFETVEDCEGAYKANYLGSFMSLDPCGRYHHVLSPNGITSRCEHYWENLDQCANDLGGWIESGEGDSTDIFLCFPID